MKNRMNGEEELDLSVFENMNVMSLGSNCIQGMRNLTMNGLNGLVELSIGSGSLNAVERARIGSNSLNSISSLDFRSFSNMRVIEIGSESMNRLKTLNARRLNELRRMSVGESSLISIEE